MPRNTSAPVLRADKKQRSCSRAAGISSHGRKHWLIALGAKRVRILMDGGL